MHAGLSKLWGPQEIVLHHYGTDDPPYVTFKLFCDSWTAQVALFSYNFGDFRHEISMYRPLSQNYSYAYNRFFFTDELGAAGALKDDGWIVCRVAANAACTRAASLV